MSWYHFNSPDDPEFDKLAERFHLHSLHVEDARSPGERVKVESSQHYTFALLKTLTIRTTDDEPELDIISIFAGHTHKPASQSIDDTECFCIVIADTKKLHVAQVLRRGEQEQDKATPQRLLYLIFDAVVDSYFPAVDAMDDRIDLLEDRVLNPTPELLNSIFDTKRQVVDMRRLLVSTRDASMHLQREPGVQVDSEQQLFLRDLYDHTSRLLDSIETQRDLLNNALDIYLTSTANRTNEVVKVLTVLSTVALPALIITGVYGMNVKGLPFADSPHGAEDVAACTVLLTGALLLFMRIWRSI